ncbi:MAG TPA: RNA 2',3'-cyclic phosphodiesterase [Lysobacter sp.]
MTDRPDDSGAAHRLFFALWPGDGVRASLASAVEASDLLRDAGRRVAPAKYHITLHFLGGWPTLPADMLDRARAAAEASRCAPFHLVVEHAGGFHGARVGWLAPSGNSGLDALWSGLRHALDDTGVPYRAHERFAPHVTVARDVRGRLGEATVDPVSWPVDDFALVHSHAGRYDVVGRWPLRAP